MQGKPSTAQDKRVRAQAREIRLKGLGYDTYNAYLHSPAWRDVRERYRASDMPQICRCGSTRVQLHHTTYDRVGQEHVEDLIALCKDCHTAAHVLVDAGVIDLDLFGFYYDPVRAAENRIIEDARKAQAAKESATTIHKDHDFYQTRKREGEIRRAAVKQERGRTFFRKPKAPAVPIKANREDLDQRSFGLTARP